MNRPAIVFLASMLALIIVIAGCTIRHGDDASCQSKKIQLTGSDTMLNLGAAWADGYSNQHPSTNITVTGGGSGTGIAALLDGHTDIAQSSRAIKPEELRLARQNGIHPTATVVAIDGLSVIVNKANNLQKLTIEQLSHVFTGQISNWKQLGGEDQEITVVCRTKTSGSYAFFLENVIRMGSAQSKKEYAKSAVMIPSNEGIAARVASDPSAVGYVGLEFIDPKRHNTVAVGRSKSAPFVKPSAEAAVKGDYPVSRPLYWYTNGKPTGEIKQLIDYINSSEGQKIARKLGFVVSAE